ncbi:MAG: cellulase family glycosylhydrolase [bacterium]|nr:cellulase family glycosylhydrolase [bacterium]
MNTPTPSPLPTLAMAAALLLSACATTSPEAVTGSSRTWTFEDNTLGDWVPQEGTWVVQQGAVYHDDLRFKGGLAGLPGTAYEDVAIEADVTITQTLQDRETVWVGLIVRASNPVANGGWRDGYIAFIRANGKVELVRAGEGTLASVQTDLDPKPGPVRLRLEATGPRLRVFADGKKLIDVTDSFYPTGEVALINFGTVARFTNVSVSGTPLPAAAVAAVEPEQPKPEKRDPVLPLPRIAIRTRPDGAGEFYVQTTGERFTPRGFNHTVLQHRTSGWHATFNLGVYNAAQLESTLAAMKRFGANCVRVWAWGYQDETGFTGGPDSCGLNAAYMENFVDFLRRATMRGMYVIPILDETPHNAYYDNVAIMAEGGTPDWTATGLGRQYLMKGPIAAKRQAVLDFVAFVKQADPNLLPTVLGWSFANEVSVNHTELPFMRVEGTATMPTGLTYDLADIGQRQACYDDTIVYWANELAAAVKAVDPAALTTAGMWTSDAHGRSPDDGLVPDDKDPRRPPRPSALARQRCALDFLDVHIYPWDGTSKVRARAHERSIVMARGVPAIVGEYGVFKHNSLDEARVMLADMLGQAYAMGYQGDLFWVWDMRGVSGQTWSAVEGDSKGLIGEHAMQLRAEPPGAPGR